MKVQFKITKEHEKESLRLQSSIDLYYNYTLGCDCPSALCIKEKLKDSVSLHVGTWGVQLTPHVDDVLYHTPQTTDIRHPAELLEYISWWDGKKKAQHDGVLRNPLYRPSGVFELNIPFEEEFLKDEVILENQP